MLMGAGAVIRIQTRSAPMVNLSRGAHCNECMHTWCTLQWTTCAECRHYNVYCQHERGRVILQHACMYFTAFITTKLQGQLSYMSRDVSALYFSSDVKTSP
jgi:hypothetical protein